MRTVIVSSADLSQPGAPLSAEFWAGRRDGESYPDWQRRTDAAAQVALAARYLRRAIAALERAETLLGNDS